MQKYTGCKTFSNIMRDKQLFWDNKLPQSFHASLAHIVRIYREGVDKYHPGDQLRLSQGIFKKRENERETVADLIIT